MQQHHIHHLHDLNHVHYDTRSHDQYPAHHHEWAGNQFNTVTDNNVADDHNVTTGVDHDHGGFDLHFS